jgi:hypothetical protein
LADQRRVAILDYGFPCSEQQIHEIYGEPLRQIEIKSGDPVGVLYIYDRDIRSDYDMTNFTR